MKESRKGEDLLGKDKKWLLRWMNDIVPQALPRLASLNFQSRAKSKWKSESDFWKTHSCKNVGWIKFDLTGIKAVFMAVINSVLSHDVKRYGSMGKHKGGNDDWRTSRRIFDNLNSEFSFTIDAVATWENKLCVRYFDIASDALEQCWQGESLFCNPSYSQLPDQQVYEESIWARYRGVYCSCTACCR